jgi:Uma2 family endonuclease
MSMPAPVYYTAEMVRELPEDGNRYEVVHGELLVTPSPRALHQRAQRRLAVALDNYLAGRRVGELFFAPADISWAPDTLVQPDIFVVRLEESATLDWTKMRTLLLAVEVLSPSSTRADRFTKRRLYQEQRIPQYWVVDADQRQVEVWTPGAVFPVVERERLLWHPEGASEACEVKLGEIFATD